MTRRKQVMPHPTIDAKKLDRIAQKIVAARAKWRSALGVPPGIAIPPKPLPTTMQQLESELAEITAKLEEVTAERLQDACPGRERDHLGRLMVKLLHRRSQLLSLKKQWGDPGT